MSTPGQHRPHHRRTASLLLATIALLALAVLSVSSLPVLNEYAGSESGPNSAFIEAQLVRAGTGYATAKAVNALVSLAQSVEIGFSLGVFVNISPAEVLDPVNDMAETVANAFLLALGALALERVLIEINYWLAFGVLIPVSLGLTALGIWGWALVLRLGLRLLALGVVVGVFLPLSIQASRVVDASVMRPWSMGAFAALQQGEREMLHMQEDLKGLSQEELGTLPEAEGEQGQESWFSRLEERFSAAIDGASDALDVQRPGRILEAMLPRIERRADAMLSQFIHLLVSILINTLLIPVATLMALWHLMRGALGLPLARALPPALNRLPNRP